MNTSNFNRQGLGTDRWFVHVMARSVCLGLWWAVCLAGGVAASLQESQVKGLFLLNFAKYVDWPPTAFAEDTSPMTIGIWGESKLTETLKILVAGKSIGNHTIAVRQIEESDDFTQCHILFISDSAAARMPGILEKAAALPILTVGENDAFARYGGIINFVLKNGNVRLEIDLAAARKAGLTISSRLLAVADVVKGKSN